MENQWYVYALCDPDTEEPFYIGKGKGDRMYYHERTLNHRSNNNPAKREAIRQILNRGKQVLKKKLAEFDDQSEAYVYEVALIKQYRDQLTNIKPGGGRLVYPSELPKEPTRIPPKIYTLDDPYMPVEQVAALLGWSKERLDRVVKQLGIKKYKFPFHMRKWTTRKDIVCHKAYQPRTRHSQRSAL